MPGAATIGSASGAQNSVATGLVATGTTQGTALALEADIKAFKALMGHLKTADTQHTVLMVQVENEAGTWGGVRDYSPAAQKLSKSGAGNPLSRSADCNSPNM